MVVRRIPIRHDIAYTHWRRLTMAIVVTIGVLLPVMTFIAVDARDGWAQDSSRPSMLEVLRDRLGDRWRARREKSGQSIQIAGLRVSVWRPAASWSGPRPLVVFSHGFHGSRTQSTFLMKALADAGYLVVAPDHKDAFAGGGPGGLLARPETGFLRADLWTDATYRDRGGDIVALVKAIETDPRWSRTIEPLRLALAGHSLGGYTVLGLAGAWSSWKMPAVKAVLALSPYAAPYIRHGRLGSMGIPVMYQGGTRDLGITPSVSKRGGAFDLTASPAYFVEFDGAGHFAWTDLNATYQESIVYYCRSFLDRHLLGMPSAEPTRRRSDVATLRSK